MEKHCFLCGRNGAYDRLERHHVFEGANRQMSEKYGAVVYLCGDRCHRNGAKSAHRCKETKAFLHAYMQKKLMRENHWSREDFIKIFGRNYLEDDDES